MELKEQYTLKEKEYKDLGMFNREKLLNLLQLYVQCSHYYKWYDNPSYYGEDYSIEHLNKIITKDCILSQEL